MSITRPPIAITMGDAAGIGPEITLKLLADPQLAVRPFVIGDSAVLRATAGALGLTLEIVEIDGPKSAALQAGRVDVLAAGEPITGLRPGAIDAACGAAAFAYIRKATELARSGEIAAIADQFGLEAQDIGGKAVDAVLIIIAALAQDIEEKHRTLHGVLHIFKPGVCGPDV